MRPDQYFDWQALHGEDVAPTGTCSRKRLRMVLAAFALLVGVVLARAVELEVTAGSRFRQLAARSLTKEVPLPAMRGRILARDGTVLACDAAITSLAVYYRYLEEPPDALWLRSVARARLPKRDRRDKQRLAAMEATVLGERSALHAQLQKLCGFSQTEWTRRIAKIQTNVTQLAERVHRRRLARYEQSLVDDAEEPITWRQWRIVLASLLSAEEPRPPAPVVIAEQLDYHIVRENLSAEAIAAVRAAGDRLAGVRLVEHTRRHYPLGMLSAQVVGHVGRSSAGESPIGQSVGRMGIEAAQEIALRGDNGMDVKRTSHRGVLLGVERLREPQPGQDLRLAIDVEAQRCAESLLDRACRAAATGDRQPAAVGGAIVVLDIHTGETLALASAPRFDPNWFAGSGSPEMSDSLTEVLNDQRRPLFDRAIKMAIPPGSVFKTLTSVALLESGTVQASYAFQCQGYLREPEQQRCLIYRRFGVGHGDVTLSDALTQSCNVYFFHHATELGSGPLVAWSRQFGFGRKTGIELPDEAAGNVPTASSAAALHKHAWRSSDTQAFAIGQSTLTVTPLQVARLMAAIANGGRLVQPTILARGNDRDSASSSVSSAKAIKLHPETLSTIRQGLARVVSDPNGTAYSTARLQSIAIAGKTGTAENGTSADHGWFAGYAPAQEPKLAFVVVLEHAPDGTATAASIARRMVEQLAALGYFPASKVEIATQPEFPGKG